MKVFIRSTIIVLCALAFSICAVAATNSLLKVFRKSNAVEDPIEINQASQFTFNALEDGTVEVTGLAEEYSGKQPLIITVPSADAEGKEVSKIGDYAFQETRDGFRVTSITLPSTLKIIGKGAFSPAQDILTGDSSNYKQGSSFAEIVIPSTVTEIGEDAFRGCACLKTITFSPESQLETIGANAFGLQYPSGGIFTSLVCGITSIEIPSSVVEIGEGAFRGCTSLTSVTFQPESKLQTIGANAFSTLTYLSGPYSGSIFSFVCGITSIEIPSSVVEIGESAFRGCTSLTSVTFQPESQLQTIGANAFGSETYTYGVGSYNGTIVTYACKINSIVIPKGVSVIHTGTFSSTLKELTFEDGSELQTIEQNPISATSTSSSSSILALHFPCSLKDWCEPTIEGLGNFNITELYLNGSKIEGDVSFDNDITSIRPYCFKNLKDITGIKLGNGVTTIGEYAFSGCTFSGEIQIPASYTTIEPYAFAGISGSFTIPSTVTEIGDHAFTGGTGELTITFAPDSNLKTIGSYAFAGVERTKTDYHPGSSAGTEVTTSIETSLVSITIPKSVIEIKDHAFYMCTNLKTLEFEQESQLEIIGSYAFAGESYRSNYTYRNQIYSTYTHASNKLSTVTIPKNVTTIGSHAFYGCTSLETLSFEEESKLETIGDYAFAGEIYLSSQISNMSNSKTSAENKISSITIPKSVTTIGDHAFYLCSSLETVNFDPESQLETIGDYAFAGAIFDSYSSSSGSSTQSKVTNNISTITIPKSVTSIGNYAFYYCQNLVSVELPAGLTQINNYTFAQCVKLSTINLDNITYFGDNAFNGCAELTNLPLNSGLTYIGSSAFSGCTGLTGQYIIPESVETIGSKAFDGCTGIDLIILANKSKYDAFKSRLDADKTTYVVKISYKTSTGITQTDNKLYKKALSWALVGDTWQSGQEYNMPAGTWLLGEETVDKDQLDAKLLSGDIDTDITLIDDSLTHRVDSNRPEIYGTSEEGVSKDLTLKVEEIEDTQSIQEKLADKYSANIKKVYIIELQQGSEEYTQPTDLVIYFNESLAGGFGVYLLNEELEKQTAQDGYYTYQGNNCTLVVIDEKIRYLKEEPFTAETSEPAGFEEGITLTVQSITEEAGMQAQLGEQYNRLVKRVYVVELTGSNISSEVTISSTDSFEGYIVKVLQAGELVDWTGKYSYTNAKLILALLVEPKMSITESGFTAETTDPLGFPEDVTLTVTEITDTEELKLRLGDNYNSRIKKMYIIELKQGEQKYTDETVKIYVDKAFANGRLVYLLKDTPELQTPTDRYELEGTEITLILEEKITPPAKEDSKPDNWKPWIIVGIIFGIYLLLLLLLIILLIIKRKKREKMQNKTLKK